jgi:hypothetical protein
MQQPETGRSGVEGLEPGAQAGRWAREDKSGHPRRRLGRTLALRILLEVVLVEAIGIDAPLLVWTV